jgi:hypothetical protein
MVLVADSILPNGLYLSSLEIRAMSVLAVFDNRCQSGLVWIDNSVVSREGTRPRSVEKRLNPNYGAAVSSDLDVPLQASGLQ